MVQRLCTTIVEQAGQVRIDDLAFQAGLSARQLRRQFLDQIGLSPKHFCRVIRFRNSLSRVPQVGQGEWAQVAAEHGYQFDTVQMPLNVMDAHFRSFGKMVLPELVSKGIGVLGMKSMGDTLILKSGAVKPIECLHYAMNLPTSVVITGIDSMKILDQAFEAVRTFHPMNEQEVAALLAKTAPYAKQGKFELFKTSDHFDSTAHHPEWLGGQSPHVDNLAGPPG